MTASEEIRTNGHTAPVFIEFGRRPDEPGTLVHPGARERYPADVLDRLDADAAQIVSRYSSGDDEQARQMSRSALLPLLHLVQSVDGYISPAGIEFCAAYLGLATAEVSAVATFYSMYRRRPTGDYFVGVCTNTLCAVLGGDAILADLSDHLGIEPGDTTEDGSITLEHIECNAACDYAPVLMVNWEFFDNQTPQSARDLVDELRKGEQVTPTRGAPLCTFRETARVLAGFPDERPNAVAAAQPGEATLAGLRIARKLAANTPAAPEREGE
ncbi:NADH-quinone oxidoreductase subunit NuoE [Aldersonia kunmingensis]|uniref:NADH-quinone oxidoreductase subunit NuoE n=1 Tax=Aldersonia kunmingensis TaxID=408066 RepID=UPI00082E81E9|nr:NADH-quinone oxidoreductase subunit NuoE [Aldersonia kunmingensis]